MFALLMLAEEGPNTDLSWLLWLAFAAFVLAAVAGWLTSGDERAEPPAATPNNPARASSSESAAPRPRKKPAPRKTSR